MLIKKPFWFEIIWFLESIRISGNSVQIWKNQSAFWYHEFIADGNIVSSMVRDPHRSDTGDSEKYEIIHKFV